MENKKEMRQKMYVTQSLYEASYLLTKGFKIAGKDRSGTKVRVQFEDDPEISKEALAFYNGGLVNAKLYTDNYRTIKDFVFER